MSVKGYICHRKIKKKKKGVQKLSNYRLEKSILIRYMEDHFVMKS